MPVENKKCYCIIIFPSTEGDLAADGIVGNNSEANVRCMHAGENGSCTNTHYPSPSMVGVA